jgi:hypothetical protein
LHNRPFPALQRRHRLYRAGLAVRPAAALLCALLIAPALALAQPRSKKPAESEPDKDFTIGLEMPAMWTSAVENPSSESIVNRRRDRYISPELYVRWSHQYDLFRATAKVGASLDRHAKTTAADLDSLLSSFKIERTDGKSDLFVPYISVTNEKYFRPIFAAHDSATNEVAVGFSTGIGWRDRELIPYVDSLISYSDASNPGDVAVSFDASFGRRFCDYSDYQNTFVAARLDLAYYISATWRVEVAATFRARWYEEYAGERRTDLRPGGSIGLVWTPDWLRPVFKGSEITFSFEYNRNYSTLPEQTYSIWEVGPTVSLRAEF